MKEVIKLIKENVNGYLATVEDGKPRVRPFGFMLMDEGKFYFCTNSMKEVYKQMMITPYVEFSVTTKDMVIVRIRGKIKFCEDIDTKSKVLNVYETVKNGYKSADNPIFKVFYIEHGTATVSDFTGMPPKKVEF